MCDDARMSEAIRAPGPDDPCEVCGAKRVRRRISRRKVITGSGQRAPDKLIYVCPNGHDRGLGGARAQARGYAATGFLEL